MKLLKPILLLAALLLLSSTTLAKPGYVILRENMIAAGRALPANTDAHHIAPENEGREWAVQYADEARAILERWNININHEANGVALPTSSEHYIESIPNAYSHKIIHTKVYYMNIADELGNAVSKESCIAILREIGAELSNGTYPIKN